MSVVTVCKDAIVHNHRTGWGKRTSRPPVRVQVSPFETAGEAYGNYVQVYDASGNVVAVVVASKDGQPIAAHGVHVVIFTEYDAKIIR